MKLSINKFNHLGLLLLLGFLSGCQALQSQKPVDATYLDQALSSQEQSLYEQLSSDNKSQFNELIAEFQEANAAAIQDLMHKVAEFREQNLRFHNQHTFQLEELSHQLARARSSNEPGFNSDPAPDVVNSDGLLVFGRYEWVAFPDQNFVISARVDSGANTSSMHAIDITELEKDGKTWIRFTTQYKAEGEDEPRDIEIEAPLVRRVTIRQASGSESRPVVSLRMQLGSMVNDTEFTLTDRGDMSHPALLGRRFMKDIALINVAEQYLQPKPELDEIEKQAPLESDRLDPELETAS